MSDGCEGLRAHYWFKGVDWAAVASMKQEVCRGMWARITIDKFRPLANLDPWQPQVPHVPRLSADDDLRHFEIEESEIIARNSQPRTLNTAHNAPY
jgi:hypothetical protein